MVPRLPIEIPEMSFTKLPVEGNLKFHLQPAMESVKADLFVTALKSAPKSESKEEKKQLVAVPAPHDGLLKGALTALVQRQQFTAAEGKSAVVYVGTPNIRDAGILGLGANPPSALSILDGFNMSTTDTSTQPLCPSIAAKAGKTMADMVSSTKSQTILLAFNEADLSPCGLECLLEGFLLAVTPDERFKSQKSESTVDITDVYVSVDGPNANTYAKVLERVQHTASGIQLTRELLNAPANYCNTESLAKAAISIAKTYGLEHIVLGEKECCERKMGAYLAVHQGSLYEPQFIHLTYKPQGPVKKRVAFVGKGICMDTGGYNLKVGCGIETMKMDMGGAAALLGAARIIGGLKPENLEVHFIVAAAENMISARAYRPGDIVTASNGKTIEVGNTDAEGRLTLADALVYADTVVKPDVLLDCATLTGASMVALGTDIGALYGDNETWTQTVLKSAKQTGTALWPMPLFKPYRKLNDSKLADLSNISSARYGGSITAALFLREFVKDTPWCHLDMAGPVYDYSTKEGTGYGAKLLATAAINAASQ